MIVFGFLFSVACPGGWRQRELGLEAENWSTPWLWKWRLDILKQKRKWAWKLQGRRNETWELTFCDKGSMGGNEGEGGA